MSGSDAVWMLLCLWVWRLCIYLHVEDGKDADLVSQHAFCPVLIHPSDYSQYLILDGEHTSETNMRHMLLSPNPSG